MLMMLLLLVMAGGAGACNAVLFQGFESTKRKTDKISCFKMIRKSSDMDFHFDYPVHTINLLTGFNSSF